MSGHGHFRGLGRRPVGLSAVLTGEDGRFQRPAKLVDLGLGGARLLSDDDLPVGTAVRLAVSAPNRWDAVELEARIAWTRPVPGGAAEGAATELGVKFEHSTRKTVSALLDLMVGDAYD